MRLPLCFLALLNIHLLNGSPLNPYQLYDLKQILNYDLHQYPNLHSNVKRIFFSDSWSPLGKPVYKNAKNVDKNDFYRDNLLYNKKKLKGLMPLSPEINTVTQSPKTISFPELFVSSGWGPAGRKRKRRLFLKSLFNSSDEEDDDESSADLLETNDPQVNEKNNDATDSDRERQEEIDKELADIFNPIFRTIHLGGRSGTDKFDLKRKYKPTPYIVNIQGRRYKVGKSGLSAREIQAKSLATLAYLMQVARTRPDPYKRKQNKDRFD